MVHFTLFLSSIFSFIKEKKDRFLIFSFLILFIFATLRYNYGNDYISYYNYFLYIKDTGKNPFGIEYLFLILNKIIPSFQLLITISSAFFLFTVLWLIKTNSNKFLYGISVFIFLINPYLFLMNLSAIRQSIAISFFIIAVNYAYKRKIIPYLLCILCSFFFHKSSIILLPFYFIINNKKFNVIFYILTFIILFFVFLAKEKILLIINNIISLFNDKNYEYYIQNNSNNSLRSTLLSSIYLIYVLLNINKMEGRILAYTKLYFFAIIFALLGYVVAMSTRFQMFFDIFSIVALPNIFIYNFKKSKGFDRILNVYLFPLLLLIIYILRYYSFFTNDMWISFREYHTFLFK